MGSVVVAEVGEPVPGEGRLATDDEVIPKGRDGVEEGGRLGADVLVEQGLLALVVDDAEVEGAGAGMQVDAADVIVLGGVESHLGPPPFSGSIAPRMPWETEMGEAFYILKALVLPAARSGCSVGEMKMIGPTAPQRDQASVLDTVRPAAIASAPLRRTRLQHSARAVVLPGDSYSCSGLAGSWAPCQTATIQTTLSSTR